MNCTARFVMTQSEEAAEELIKRGFYLFLKHDNTYYFENKPEHTYCDTDIKGIVFTNRVLL
jgi:hypothetical protein